MQMFSFVGNHFKAILVVRPSSYRGRQRLVHFFRCFSSTINAISSNGGARDTYGINTPCMCVCMYLVYAILEHWYMRASMLYISMCQGERRRHSIEQEKT